MNRVSIIFVLMIAAVCSGCSANPEGPNQYLPRSNQTARESTAKQAAELQAKLIYQSEQILNRQYYFTFQQSTARARLKDLGASTNIDGLLQELRRSKNLDPKRLQLKVSLDEKVAAEKISALTQQFNVQAKDASFEIKQDNTMEIVPHTVGKEVNISKALQDFKQAVHSQQTAIFLEVQEKLPQVTTEHIEAIKLEGTVASFSTNYPVNNPDRTENLRKAAGCIDMKVLKPGEVFSFNSTVGPRTQDKGYKEALIIVENQYVPGVGGGVCQVSSTLYNIALLADLEIVERHRHQFVIPYLPPGRDATVVYGQADLRFKNNTPGLLLLRTQAKGGVLKMSLFGKKTNKRVEIKTEIAESKDFEIERRIDPSLGVGETKVEQGGVKGYTSTTYRVVKTNNQEVKREQISKDVYKPANKIVKVGPSRGQILP